MNLWGYLIDYLCKVEVNDLGEDLWSLSRTYESSYLDSGLSFSTSAASKCESETSPHLIDDDFDEPLAFVHTSSRLSRKMFNSRQERYREVAVQTDFRDFLQGIDYSKDKDN